MESKEIKDFKMGTLVEMPLEEFKSSIESNDLGYARGCNNLLKMCFDNVSKKVEALLKKSVEYKERKDIVMSKTFGDYASRLIYSQKCMEDKLVFLKDYISRQKLN